MNQLGGKFEEVNLSNKRHLKSYGMSLLEGFETFILTSRWYREETDGYCWVQIKISHFSSNKKMGMNSILDSYLMNG